jgi:DNA-binding PadR family transcriptional regulator
VRAKDPSLVKRAANLRVGPTLSHPQGERPGRGRIILRLDCTKPRDDFRWIARSRLRDPQFVESLCGDPSIHALPSPFRAFSLRAAAYFFYCIEQMPRGELLGSLEHIILLALVRLGENAYGMTVRREIEERTGRNLSIGAVYATLERLEAKGYISSFIGESTAARGGRAKRLFRIEADGQRALLASQEAIRKMTLGLKNRWGTA